MLGDVCVYVHMHGLTHASCTLDLPTTFKKKNRETAAYEADQHLLLGPSVSRPSSPLASPRAGLGVGAGGGPGAGAVRLPAWRVFEAVEAAEDKVRLRT